MQNRFFVCLFSSRGTVEATVTPNPSLDVLFRSKKFGQTLDDGAVVSPPLPAWLAWRAAALVGGKLKRRKRPVWCRQVRGAAKEVRRLLRGRKVLAGFPAPITGLEGAVPPTEETLGRVLETLQGRVAVTTKVQERLFRRGVLPSRPLPELLYWLQLLGKVRLLPGVRMDRWGRLTCSRCGGTNIVFYPCAACGNEGCPHCQDCSFFGPVRGCDSVVLAPGKQKECFPAAEPDGSRGLSPGSYQLEFALTSAQQAISDRLCRVVRDNINCELQDVKRHLVWAVCGAGKTEVVFAAVGLALSASRSVLYAVPRRDVVVQLHRRFARGFPHAPIAALHGGSADREPSALTVATTHQVLRFYRAFPLVILDEVDAFPYRGSQVLHRAVEQAIARPGILIYLTATPDAELTQEIRRGQLDFSCIPVRHHGYPLPEPEVAIGSAGRSWKELTGFLRSQTEDGRKVLVFVPTVAEGLQLAARLKAEEICTAFTHAGDSNRDRQVAAFCGDKVPVLVCTTILERGVTVPRTDVVVWQADRLFSAESLVQMAGRTGRTAEDPTGKVLFICQKRSPAIKRACSLISTLNQQAKREGFLRKGYGGQPR